VVNAKDTFLQFVSLHYNYRQTAQTFKEKTGAFRKVIKKRAELGKIWPFKQIVCVRVWWEGGRGSNLVTAVQ
jgi:hypothetical protein